MPSKNVEPRAPSPGAAREYVISATASLELWVVAPHEFGCVGRNL